MSWFSGKEKVVVRWVLVWEPISAFGQNRNSCIIWDKGRLAQRKSIGSMKLDANTVLTPP